ncbi:MAG: RNA polymerase sigma factor [Gammaproteobacteria bacterium]|nr:RNA polymerase sigma factor [Gammaproteobacteria bacterium]NND39145.1 RNA polymerase sigma factor [Pseudomonadales bacterium]
MTKIRKINVKNQIDITVPASMSAMPGKHNRCEEVTLLRLATLSGYLGDQARSQLVQLHYGWILSNCKRVLRSDADAADAAQEAALAMYRALPRFEGRSSLRTWLYRIVQNACVTLIRKQQQHTMASHLESLLEIHLQQCLSASPDVEQSRDIVAGVQQTMAGLSKRSREVLQLRFFNELSLEDISITLGISLSAAKMRLYRAIDQFGTRHNALQASTA